MPHNLIVVLLDDTDPDSYEAGAFPYLASDPHGKWVKFTNSVISTPVCYASRCTEWTGQRADTCGGDIANVSEWGPPPWDETKGLPQVLANAGYQVGVIGKYLNKYPWVDLPWSRTAYVPSGVTWMRLEHNSQNLYYDWNHVDQGLTVTAHGAAAADYRTDVEAGFLLDFLAQAVEPWALFWSPLSAHLPMTLPPAHATDPVTDPRTGLAADHPDNDPGGFNPADMTGKPSYLTSVPVMDAATETAMRAQRRDMYRQHLATDDAIEGVFDWLSANGHLADTVFMMAADNGASNGRHRLSTNAGLKRHPYQHSTDMQLRVRHPDVPANRTESRIVTTVDLAATITAIAGGTPLLPEDGESFLPVILDTPNTVWRTGIEAAGFNLPVAELSAGQAPPWWAFRTERWKYVWWPDQGNGTEHEELYDLAADPAELSNVIAAEPATAAWLRARLRFARSIPDGARAAHFV